MKLGLAITALVLAVVGIISPLQINIWVMLISTAIGLAAALFGDKSFVIAVPLINIVDLVILSPATRYALTYQAGWTPVIVLCIIFALPFVAIWLYNSGVVRLGPKPTIV